MLEMIKQELDETEYKWVTYMDEVLEIWNEMANDIVHEMFVEAVCEISLIIWGNIIKPFWSKRKQREWITWFSDEILSEFFFCHFF